MADADDEAAAYAGLDEAIATAAQQLGFLEDTEMVTTWALVAHIERPDRQDTCYLNMYAGGRMPNHVAIGLFTIAAQQAGEDSGDDEDE
jgi:hypothetical protein